MMHYLALYKPDEVLCQFTDSSQRRTLKNLVLLPGVYPAGRLDYHSEGLVLLSNDGTFIQRVSDPRFEHSKIYWAQVEGVLTPEAIEELNHRIVLPGIQTRLPRANAIEPPEIPLRIRPVRAYHPTSWLQIVLTEGKKHQVRRMTAAVGFPTLRLVRYAVGPVNLKGMNPGDWRALTNTEVQLLRQAPDHLSRPIKGIKG